MGDMAEYYSDYHEAYDIEDDEDDPVWVTRDMRVVSIKDMDDKHLANTIRFLEVRGARTPEDVKNNPIAAVEATMGHCHPELQKKYMQLLAERNRRAKVLAAHAPLP